ncbi:MAG: polysaccharide biosynthesis/export family protein [Glaciecola sp.]
MSMQPKFGFDLNNGFTLAGTLATFSAFKRFLLVLFLVLQNYAYAQVSDSEYTLGSGDEIRITVFGQEDLTVETKLSNVGVIRYPFLGDITLVGKTVNQIETQIDKGLRGDYLVDPSVSVTVVEYRPFFINGEVKRPGGYPYQPGLTIDKAAAIAGGYTERANVNGNMMVRRNIAGNETSVQLVANDTVMPGDIITVQSRFF